MKWTEDFSKTILSYQDQDSWHREYTEAFEKNVIDTPWLDGHREWIVNNFWGMGDKPHWWMWKMLVEQMPESFKFLEVGVYRGSIISLVARISQELSKHAGVYAVTLLNPTNDGTHSYDDSEFGYAHDIATIFNVQAPGSPHPYLYVGRSQDAKVLERTAKTGPYDIVYIDAGHTYDDVRADLDHYRPMVRPGGFLVTDDSAFYHAVPYWKGFESVARAVRDTVEVDPEWVELFGITHNRVFYKGKRSDFEG